MLATLGSAPTALQSAGGQGLQMLDGNSDRMQESKAIGESRSRCGRLQRERRREKEHWTVAECELSG